jgi:hypothetical protein
VALVEGKRKSIPSARDKKVGVGISRRLVCRVLFYLPTVIGDRNIIRWPSPTLRQALNVQVNRETQRGGTEKKTYPEHEKQQG